MSYYQQRGGDFATSPRGKVAENYDFIRSKAAAGVPIQHIAMMIGCSTVDVQNVVGLPVLEAAMRSPALSRHSALADIKVKAGRNRQPRAEQWKAVRAIRARIMPPRARAIVQQISNRHGLDIDLVLGGRVIRGLTLARNEACYALYETGAFSLSQIGGFIGGRDHTSALNAIRNHAERLAADPDLTAWKAIGASEAA